MVKSMLLRYNQTILGGKISCNMANYITAFYQDKRLFLIEVIAALFGHKKPYDWPAL